jgi:cell division protein ZapE
VTDAMILHRLLHALFDKGTTFVMTSNYHPDLLYPEGLHRDRFLPAIDLLKSKLDIVKVDGGVDYRRLAMEQVELFHCPLGEQADSALRTAFESIAETDDESPVLTIERREIRALRRAGGIVWFDFPTLCGGPRSQLDYLEIAGRFHTVVLSGVPRLGAAMSSEARRFTWLIDVLYDHRTRLVMSAACPPEDIYVAGALAGEFQRTVSRIVEMQSREYIESERRPVAELQE